VKLIYHKTVKPIYRVHRMFGNFATGNISNTCDPSKAT